MGGPTGPVGAKDSANGSDMPCAGGGCAYSITGSGGEPVIMAAASSPIGTSMLGGR